MLAYAVVNAFVMSAQYYDVLEHGHFVGHFLVELLAVGRGEDNLVVFALAFQCGYAAVYGLALHYHAGEPAEGVVVHAAVLVGGVVAQVVHVYFNQSFLLGARQD